MLVTVKFGTGNQLQKDFPNGTSLGCVLGNEFVRGALGYGQNVQGFVGGVPQDNSIPIAEGMVISVHNAACEKRLGCDPLHS